ncbi:MAG: PDZ domain-containing protein [Bernardetiaceae bacterium]|nr:PDZ domain-containing protein [Bernardetiaceae bacterium]
MRQIYYYITIFLCVLMLWITNSSAQNLYAQTVPTVKAFIGIRFVFANDVALSINRYDNPYGAIIQNIIPETGAAASDLQAQDYVFRIDNYEASASLRVPEIMYFYCPGDVITVTFIRDGKVKTTEVTLSSINVPFAERIEGYLGVSVKAPRNPEERGLIVTQVVDNSTAFEMDLEAGDVILEVNRVELRYTAQLRSLESSVAAGQNIEVMYLKNGQSSRPFTKKRIIKSKAQTFYRPCREDIPEDKETLEKPQEAEAYTGATDNNYLRLSHEQLSPNPTTGKFQFSTRLPKKDIALWHLLDASGKILQAGENQTGRLELNLDISQEPKGIYMLRIYQNTMQATYKVIKQ